MTRTAARSHAASLASRLALLLAASAELVGCVVKDPPPVTAAWSDDFSRDDVGRDYMPTSEAYRIDDGVLRVKGAYNHPLWLRKRLPTEAVVELDVWAESPDGDLKIELYGDGSSHAEGRGAYTATGYVLCMGGWNNSKSFIARKDEHGKETVSRTAPKVELGKRYHWKITREGGTLTWFIDDMQSPFLIYEDAQPLTGEDNAYVGFNNWQSDAHFDNLAIAPR